MNIEGYKEIMAFSEQSTPENAMKSAFNKALAALAAIDRYPAGIQVAVQKQGPLWVARAIAYYV